MEIGSFVLDSLQIFFPWDDDLYTILKKGGFGTGGFKWKALPFSYMLIYDYIWFLYFLY